MKLFTYTSCHIHVKYHFSFYIMNRLLKLWLCFLSSHYHRETTCGDERLLLTQWGIQYRLSWCLVIQWTQTQQNSSYDIYRFQRFPGYISLTLSYWFQTLRPQTFTQCFCQLRADLEIFWLEIRWSKTTIRTSPLKSTGPGSWGADKRSIQAFWILLSKQASPRFEAIRKLFSWHGMGNNNLLFWIIPSSHNSMCEKSIH